jgi:probable biosynthetic protein (TIGR04098 family)
MGLARSIYDKLVTRLFARDEYESRYLRRYFYRQYGIEVGLYSIGAFDRWRIPPGTRIGRYCSIAKSSRMLDANHPIDALSTHPYFYLKEFEIVAEDRAQIRPPVIEDDVWLGHNCTIAPSCHRIGRGAVIGAGAVVMNDVPPYAIMVGAPAKLVRYRFPVAVIAAIEATQWWLLDKDELTKALRHAPDIALKPSRDAALRFLAAQGKSAELAESPAAHESATPASAPVGGSTTARLVALLQSEMPSFTLADLQRPLHNLEIDSFGLINLRMLIEQVRGRQVSDRLWGAVERPCDMLQFLDEADDRAATGSSTAPIRPAPDAAAHDMPVLGEASERRIQYINMPQMALSGLSEAWTFKEIGDLHWSVLTRGLQTTSAAVKDSEGDRLYATFTRIRLTSDIPLTGFRENDRLTLDLGMERFGAGMYFSHATIAGPHGAARADVMTTFSKFGEAGANTSLLKGQPEIPEGCQIGVLAEMPSFSHEYRARRAATLPPTLFETEYSIVPPHDINGVGLLYFAAYPIIVDICAMRHGPPAMLSNYSTTVRDVFYFANSMPDDTLIFRVHGWDEADGVLRFDSSLSRKSDGKLMAYIATTKVLTAQAS